MSHNQTFPPRIQIVVPDENTVFVRCVIYDMKRDRYVDDGEFLTVEAAKEAFAFHVNMAHKDWEKRSLDRYYLVQQGTTKGEVYTSLAQPSVQMVDWEVPFNAQIYRWKDPPYDDASQTAYEQACERILAQDEAMRAKRRGNYFEPEGRNDAA